MQNETLTHALKCLAHPLSLLMITLLIVNDHIFKHMMPSWWTGKLSDVAGLAFAPLLVAVFLAVVIPSTIQHQKSTVFWASFFFVGVIFALLKISPSFNQNFRDGLHMLTGNQYSIVLDSTDLLALPALLVAYWLWHEKHEFHPSRPMMVLGLTLASMGTLATSVMDNYGATCLRSRNNEIQVLVDFGTYHSTDGGLTWEYTNVQVNDWNDQKCIPSEGQIIHQSIATQKPYGWRYTLPNEPNHIYNFNSKDIQVSLDKGQTWQIEYSFNNNLDKREVVYWENRHSLGFQGSTRFGPQDALIDDKSGNLIVTMGYHGILVRQGDENWMWIGIENHDYNKMVTHVEYVHQQNRKDIWGYVASVSILISLISMIIIGQAPSSFSTMNIFYTILVALMLSLSLALAHISIYTTALCAIPMVIILAIILLAIFEQLEAYQSRIYYSIFGLTIFPLISFILPYYLWYRDILNDFTVTHYLAFGSAISAIFLSRYIFQRYVKPIVSIEEEK